MQFINMGSETRSSIYQQFSKGEEVEQDLEHVPLHQNI